MAVDFCECVACELNKPEKTQSRAISTQRIVQEPWSVVATDIVERFVRSKRSFKYLVVFQDLITYSRSIKNGLVLVIIITH